MGGRCLPGGPSSAHAAEPGQDDNDNDNDTNNNNDNNDNATTTTAAATSTTTNNNNNSYNDDNNSSSNTSSNDSTNDYNTNIIITYMYVTGRLRKRRIRDGGAVGGVPGFARGLGSRGS